MVRGRRRERRVCRSHSTASVPPSLEQCVDVRHHPQANDAPCTETSLRVERPSGSTSQLIRNWLRTFPWLAPRRRRAAWSSSHCKPRHALHGNGASLSLSGKEQTHAEHVNDRDEDLGRTSLNRATWIRGPDSAGDHRPRPSHGSFAVSRKRPAPRALHARSAPRCFRESALATPVRCEVSTNFAVAEKSGAAWNSAHASMAPGTTSPQGMNCLDHAPCACHDLCDHVGCGDEGSEFDAVRRGMEVFDAANHPPARGRHQALLLRILQWWIVDLGVASNALTSLLTASAHGPHRAQPLSDSCSLGDLAEMPLTSHGPQRCDGQDHASTVLMPPQRPLVRTPTRPSCRTAISTKAFPDCLHVSYDLLVLETDWDENFLRPLGVCCASTLSRENA
mmetsp:Transcript_48517/g.128579  ORF Transcript_48517/g.128579 Transcript_48517/m.128579 type:complete len:393 (-) Transcript_48517:2059-3237(-)